MNWGKKVKEIHNVTNGVFRRV